MKHLSRRTFINSLIASSLTLPLINLASCSSTPPIKDPTDDNPPDDNHTPEGIPILFLGTGATDWNQNQYPIDRSDLISGKHRGFSSILINNSILIDCGSTTPKALDMFGIDTNSITDILITHSRKNHFDVKSIIDIQTRRSINDKINLWVNEGVLSYFTKLEKDTGCEVKTISAFKHYLINGFNILPLEANHQQEQTSEQCLHFFIKKKDKTFFYAIVGGWFTIKTWNILKEFKIDAMVFDATWGDHNDLNIFSHNNLSMIRLMLKAFIKDGVFEPRNNLILSHLGYEYTPAHDVFQKNVADERMIVAYDGLEILI